MQQVDNTDREDLVCVVERTISLAINSIVQLHLLSERQYCEIVLEALDLLRVGLEMRQSELSHDAADG